LHSGFDKNVAFLIGEDMENFSNGPFDTRYKL
jgi:hypothetical protein